MLSIKSPVAIALNIDETDKSFAARKRKEHIRDVKKLGFRIANHACPHNHDTDRLQQRVDLRRRKFLHQNIFRILAHIYYT